MVLCFFLQSAQDRSPFCIFHIMNEILQHPELMDTFLVRNHCHIFRKIIKSNVVSISKGTNEYYQKIIKKSGHKMDLYLAMHNRIGQEGEVIDHGPPNPSQTSSMLQNRPLP